MIAEKLNKYLISLHACKEAIKWAEGKDLKTAWQTCDRGDWLIWLLCNSKNEVTDRELRLIAVRCARQVQHLMTDPRSIAALAVSERYANGEASDEKLSARAAARVAAWAAAWAAEGAARAAAWAARAAAWAEEGADALSKQADIVREIVPLIKIKA